MLADWVILAVLSKRGEYIQFKIPSAEDIITDRFVSQPSILSCLFCPRPRIQSALYFLTFTPPPCLSTTALIVNRGMAINWQDPNNYVLASFLCVLGAAVGFCMVYAVAWLLRGKNPDEEPNRFVISNDQALYMKEVRHRNLQVLAVAAGGRGLVEDDLQSTAGQSRSRWTRASLRKEYTDDVSGAAMR